MSLTTQLTRGTLALPMLVLFGVLALVSGEPLDTAAPESGELPAANGAAHERTEVLVAGRRLVLAARAGEAACLPLRPAMLLAPADLGPIAPRQGNACRAAS